MVYKEMIIKKHAHAHTQKHNKINVHWQIFLVREGGEKERKGDIDTHSTSQLIKCLC